MFSQTQLIDGNNKNVHKKPTRVIEQCVLTFLLHTQVASFIFPFFSIFLNNCVLMETTLTCPAEYDSYSL